MNRHISRPIQETLREGFEECFPGLKLTGVDDEGRQLYSLADLAEVLGTGKNELLALADEKGIRDSLHTGTVNQMH